ncbi:GtrA family protein [Parapedobacter sp. SGR-10]|uniref:GtrA family protein n=1 Tax=Parapedobacter sp. SGR-10 TaxID=2710879 RepID=UPI00197D2A9F|nr:GtrA family protein [Parapedobacter sp. SGR-10]
MDIHLDPQLITKFIMFSIVGASGVVVDFSVTWLFKEKVRIHKYIANSLGFIVATISNYLLNRFWTFYTVDAQAKFNEFSKFFFIALIGLAINNAILYLFHEKLKWNFYLSKLVAIGIVSIWNFSFNYLYTFTSS